LCWRRYRPAAVSRSTTPAAPLYTREEIASFLGGALHSDHLLVAAF
jgi:hypothetical protein